MNTAAFASGLPANLPTPWRSRARIPVRNLWVLLAYAAELAEFLDRVDAELDEEIELADILARLLTAVVERRLRRNLSRGYRPRKEVLSRVRGRINWLETATRLHLLRGRIACEYEDFTFDTPRNRLVRVALEAMGARVPASSTGAECLRLARSLAGQGVSAQRPSPAELAQDVIASHQSDDRLMVTVARLALDLVLPGETSGSSAATRLDRDEALLRRIFEKAIAGFYRHELQGRDGWSVRTQTALDWGVQGASPAAAALLPGMKPDLVLDQAIRSRRIVLDTKFTGALASRHHGGEAFKSDHIYQLYAYLRSQAGRGNALADRADGILLYPAIDRELDEEVTIQGHRIRFVTVNIAAPAHEMLARLRSLPLS